MDAESPQRSEDLKQTARPVGHAQKQKRPLNKSLNLHLFFEYFEHRSEQYLGSGG